MSLLASRPAILVALLIAAGACRNIDVVTASYATLDEAKKAGAIERGWVPDGLPPGTTEIRDAHDLDSNRHWGLFLFPRSEGDVLRRLLQPDEATLAGRTTDIPGRVEWWPVLLRGALKHEQLAATGARAYAAKSGDLVFVINWNQGRAYYWTR